MEMDVDPSSGRRSPDDREKILRTFEAWLDRALADEQPPQRLTAELLAAIEPADREWAVRQRGLRSLLPLGGHDRTHAGGPATGTDLQAIE